jgi:hypothetical protein
VGVPSTVSVTVAPVLPALGTPTGSVTVSGGAAGSCTIASLSSGSGTCVWTPLTGGTVTLTASYGGDSLFNPSAGSSTPLPVIVPYTFTGFLSPMATAGSVSTPSFSGSSTFGSAQPVKWQLKDSAGNWISRLSSTVLLQGVQYQSGCSGQATGSTTLLYSPTAGAKGGSTFRYDAPSHQFIFNWNTGYMPGPGCYELELQLDDGSQMKATVEQLN